MRRKGIVALCTGVLIGFAGCAGGGDGQVVEIRPIAELSTPTTTASPSVVPQVVTSTTPAPTATTTLYEAVATTTTVPTAILDPITIIESENRCNNAVGGDCTGPAEVAGYRGVDGYCVHTDQYVAARNGLVLDPSCVPPALP
jgi:hypothetical protein